jgi:hypothetical protein
MRDIVIPASRLAREAQIALACALLALGTNAFAIWKYSTQWSELLTAWPETLALALFLYILFALPRLALLGARRLATRLSPNKTHRTQTQP